MKPDRLTRLVAPVFEHPGDDAVRRVVEDALLEHNHAWGEFIALQFAVAERRATPAMRKRMRELLKTDLESFCGPIAKVASTLAKKKCLTFEKGFLSEVWLDKRLVPRADWEAAARSLHWATVREVHFSILTTPLWWIRKWAANPAATRSLQRFDVSHALQLERQATGWCVVKAERSRVYGTILAAFIGGQLPASQRVTITPRMPGNRRQMLEAALATIHVKPG